MVRTRILLITVLCCFGIAAGGGLRVSASKQDTGAPTLAGTATLCSAEVMNPAIIGAGVNFAFSDYVYIDFVTGQEWDGIRSQHLPYPDDEAGWTRFMRLMDFSGFQYVRLCVGMTQWEPVNDDDDPHHLNLADGFVFSPGFAARHPGVGANNRIYMEAMYRLLDHWEQRGLYVVLGNWWAGPETFCPEQKNWIAAHDDKGRPINFQNNTSMSVYNLEEFTESLAAIMVHLKRERAYDCVKGISFWNEPEHFTNYYETLAKVYTSLGTQLERHGIRDQVKIQAFDGALFWNQEHGASPHGVARLMAKAGDHIDIVSFHDYNSKLAYQKDESFPNVHGTISDYTIPDILLPAIEQARREEGTQLPVLAGEFGSFAFIDNALETAPAHFRQRLHNAAATTQLFNHGIKGVAYWIYNNNYHTHFRMLTFDEDQPQRFVPDVTNYYPLALTMKYIQRGADIIRSELTGLVDADGFPRVYLTAAVKDADTTLLWVNDADRPARVTIQGLEADTLFHHWQVTGDAADRIAHRGTWRAADDATLTLAPESISVLTTYTYGEETVE